MTLQDLIQNLHLPIQVTDKVIAGLADDSRKINAGDLFFALQGENHSSRRFIEDAITKKAAVILCEGEGESYSKGDTDVYFVPQLKRYVLKIMLRYFGLDQRLLTFYAVTGTNGKTSIAYWIAQLMEAGYFGTLGNGYWQRLNKTDNTTSSQLVTANILSDLVSENIKQAVFEVSSHALIQQRVEGLLFQSAIFTNLSHEHLDYHGSMEQYYQAKKKLFLFEGLKHAIINIDCEWGSRLASELEGVDVITFAVINQEATITVKNYQQSIDGIKADIITPKGNISLEVPFFCEFNLSNLLAIIALLYAHDEPLIDVSSRLQKLKPVCGRMDKVLSRPTVIIDYAHTPDALEKALENLKVLTPGKLWCVFGCGGDRDKAKRPVMGAIAAKYADKCIITNDNPRTESADLIANEIVSGMQDIETPPQIELDRKAAIIRALSLASEDDVILIAGKGHEDYQITGLETRYFSDHEVVQSYRQADEKA